ncbi:alpha/beta-hydrolase family protein [Williamsia sp.]|uniref:alpha/beta-hydrolase family protein n=1 Tax=Williamsia sp. TaxID=1872085 RepID=UPI001A1F64F4|nr:alpha/beta-hydrolase family protein [Williamsia sp.]MBJ7290177.1 alpha/beta-hydrolase family protein [Williamsia sp.]
MTPTRSSRLPHPAGVIGALVGAAIALAPGSLPREMSVHVALLTGCLLLGAGIGGIVGRLMPDRAGDRAADRGRRARVVGLTTAVFTGLVLANAWWQDTLRAGLGEPGPGPAWVAVSFVPVALYAAMIRAPGLTAVAVVTGVATVAGLAPATAGPQGAVEGAATMSRAAAFTTTDAAATSLRLYSSSDGRPVDHRAAELVDRWSSAGGARRAAVVVAVPTGSGWVDPDAVLGFEHRLGGDVSVIALQYSDIPSWRAFVSGTDTARAGAIAVTAALTRAVGRLPAAARPQIYLYGQSLGAIGADAARTWAATRAGSVPVCATVLAGAPAGTVAAQAPRRVVLANASDPVVRWSPRLLWRPPTRSTAPADLPRPAWFPVAGFVQASADLVGALSFPAGHGHQYGTEQGTSAPLCPGQPAVGQTSGPRAASYAAPTR